MYMEKLKWKIAYVILVITIFLEVSNWIFKLEKEPIWIIHDICVIIFTFIGVWTVADKLLEVKST